MILVVPIASIVWMMKVWLFPSFLSKKTNNGRTKAYRVMCLMRWAWDWELESFSIFISTYSSLSSHATTRDGGIEDPVIIKDVKGLSSIGGCFGSLESFCIEACTYYQLIEFKGNFNWKEMIFVLRQVTLFQIGWKWYMGLEYVLKLLFLG